MRTERAVHLVGSIPAEDAESAMRMALDQLGPWLRSLPDGETGERRDWIVHIVEALAEHPDLDVVRRGSWASYTEASRLRVRRGHRLTGGSLDFGHVASCTETLPVLRQLRREYGHELRPQVGIPGDLDMALFALGPLGAFRHRRPFTQATVREIEAINELSGGEAVFQLEIPAELVFVARMPGPLRSPMAHFLARGVASVARQAPRGARFGVHLCLGDLGNQALGRIHDAEPLVTLANAVVRAWPDGRELNYVHAPFAAGTQPAPTQTEFYTPLRRLRLPGQVRFVAGFVHESSDLEDLRATRAIIDGHVGEAVDVATACGLGRRTPETAKGLLQTCAVLADES